MENDSTSATASSSIFDPAPPPATEPRARWYTPGFSDGLGDRLLMFDNTTASSLELLRFSRECSDSPAFETALRQRVDELSAFRHPSVAAIRKVEWLGSGEEGLALVSNHTPGRRLSDLLHEARGPALALELIRKIAPVLAALQRQGPGIAHGTLTAERIVVTPEGGLVVVEHVLGAALAALDLPAGRLRSEFGIAVPPGSGPVELDARSDVVQLGFVALSLLVGRRIKASDYPDEVTTLLDEFGRTFSSSTAPPLLRRWLERALQHSDRPFSSAQEAADALNDLPNEFEPQAARVPRPIAAAGADLRREFAATPSLPDAPPLRILVKPIPVAPAPAAAEREAPGESEVGGVPDRSRSVGSLFQTEANEGPANPARWVVPALAALVALQALVIAGLLYTRTPAKSISTSATTATRQATSAPAVSQTPAVTPPLDATHAITPASLSRPDPTPAATAQTAAGPPAAHPKADAEPVLPAATPAGVFGGVRISSPIDLQVFEGGKLIGSTAGPIAMEAGSHSLDLVNDLVGYRSRETANVVAGQMASVGVTPPNGRVSINAAPWADVWIDGAPVGQTPLANLSVPLGQHEVIFRHPQLGEQRQTAVVKADTLTRISANLQH